MIEKILGIDLGISSLGWAVIEYDSENDANNAIIDCGVRLFTAAETPKEKESPNKARREARSLRRVIKRRRVRMNEIKKLCIVNRLITQTDLDSERGMFNSAANRTDVWKLRHDALHRPLSTNQFARILIHIAKHRGYDFQTEEGDAGKVKSAGEELKKKFASAGCTTVGEYLWLHPHRNESREVRRNKKDDYTISIHRDLLKAEIDAVFASQQNFGNTFATDALKEAYKKVAFYVRPMQSIEHMVGTCTYFPDQKRAPKASPTAERFVALGKFFNTVIINPDKTEHKLVELKSIDELMEFAISKEKIDHKQLRKFLGLNDQQMFKGLNYKAKPKKSKTADSPAEWEFDKAEAEKKAWISLKGHAALKAALGAERFAALLSDGEIADVIVQVLTYYKDERQKRTELDKLSLSSDAVELLCKLSFSDFNQLSIKAMRILNPIIAEGYQRYDEAVKYAYDKGLLPPKKNQKSALLPPLKETDIDILNPTVIRAFAQFRKVANALVNKYGSFDKVHFELAREVNTRADIDGMKEWQRKNEKEREAAKTWISENFGNSVPITRKNILKKRLYEQQDGRCIYTGEVIQLERLFDEGYCEIDHILPRSRSADDSFANKVLVLSKANQDKANQTPYEWFGHDTQRWERFETHLSSPTLRAKLGMKKIGFLTKKNFDENSAKEFISRNLNDTRYMARAIKTYCENYWELAHDDDKLRIQVRSGKLTSALRHQWGLDSKNRDTHTHHAADAIMIAFSTQGMVKRLNDYYKAKETRREKTKPVFALPMEHFREAVEKALTIERTETVHAKDGREITLNRLLISRPPRAGVTGAAHKETIQSPCSYKGRGVAINGGKGICDNGDMPRVDVFTKEDKYYLVPIYVADFAKEELPNKAIVAQKTFEHWDEMDTSYQFLFSLHKEDLIEIKTKKTPARPSITALGYFNSAHSGTAQIILESPDNTENEIFSRDKNKDGTPKGDSIARYGSKTLVYIKKYTIDPLGYYHEVKRETRLGTIPQELKKRRGSMEK